MSNRKQTSVEWLINEIAEKYNFRIAAFYSQEIQQAKQLHKQEIMDAYKSGSYYSATTQEAEQYYKDTYETDN